MYISKRVENRALFASTGLMSLLLSYAVSEKRRKELQASPTSYQSVLPVPQKLKRPKKMAAGSDQREESGYTHP